jgi:predicted TIM-barrel fold metal-dependent hydrolase
MALDFKLFDPWINIVPKQPEYGNMDVSYLFPDLAARYVEGRTTEQIIAEMDEAGVEQAVLAAGYDKLHDDTTWTLESIEKHPDRFFGSLVVDPHKGMDGVRELEHRVKNDGF